jgi:hypothetical protein
VIRRRRALGPLAAAWLLCQLGMVALVPAASATGSVPVVALECTCSHGDHATCPMHHKSAAGPERCAMRSADDSATGVLISLFGPLGLIPVRSGVLTPAPSTAVALAPQTTIALRDAPPDPPPPRA